MGIAEVPQHDERLHLPASTGPGPPTPDFDHGLSSWMFIDKFTDSLRGLKASVEALLSSTRTFDDVKTFMQSNRSTDPKEQNQFYEFWAENYGKDMSVLGYNGPALAADCLLSHFAGSREAALVLDVACGTGLVAQMSELGFRHFVGVDGSKGMLEQAAKTGLYQDLRLALLGTQPLPAQAGVFDVVMIVGSLRVGIVPVSAVREMCNATKPGNLNQSHQ
uniref:methyltransferase-like protein 27 n=1 Tax=Centroberyx gerrardi TaxID=166262 RepID=UPI003AAC11DB